MIYKNHSKGNNSNMWLPMYKTGLFEGIPLNPFTIFLCSKVDSITGLVTIISNLKHDSYENNLIPPHLVLPLGTNHRLWWQLKYIFSDKDINNSTRNINYISAINWLSYKNFVPVLVIANMDGIFKTVKRLSIWFTYFYFEF